MTIVELWELPDNGRRHELVDGVLIVTPPSSGDVPGGGAATVDIVDELALAALHERHAPDVYDFLAQTTDDTATTEDLVAATFVPDGITVVPGVLLGP